MYKYQIVGYLNDREVNSKIGKRMSSMKNSMVGVEIDKIHLSLLIENKNDINSIMEFLKQSTPCFKK